MENNNVIIIDHGSFSIKYGFISQNQPIISRSVSGTKRSTIGRGVMHNKPKASVISEVFFYGEEAIDNSQFMRLEPTLDNKNNLRLSSKGLYKKIFTNLGVLHDKKISASVIFLVSMSVDKIFLDQIYSIFLNEYTIENLWIVPQSLAASYYLSVDSVLDIGDAIEFTILKDKKIQSFEKLDYGGKDLTNFLCEFYDDNEYFKFDTIDIIRKFKEENVFIDLKNGEINNIKKKLIVEDDSEYEFGNELIKCGEILFDPKIINKQYKSLIDIIKSKFEKTKFKKIGIVGGSSKIENLYERLNIELSKFGTFELFKPNEDPCHISWLGAKKMFDDEILNDHNKSKEIDYDILNKFYHE